MIFLLCLLTICPGLGRTSWQTCQLSGGSIPPGALAPRSLFFPHPPSSLRKVISVEKLKANDEDEWRAIRAYAVVNAAFRGSFGQEANEIAQDACLILWRKLQENTKINGVKGYVVGIIKNLSRHKIYHTVIRQRETPLDEVAFTIRDTKLLQNGELILAETTKFKRKALLYGISGLKKRQRQVVLMRLAEIPDDDIMATLHLRRLQFINLLHAGMQKLIKKARHYKERGSFSLLPGDIPIEDWILQYQRLKKFIQERAPGADILIVHKDHPPKEPGWERIPFTFDDFYVWIRRRNQYDMGIRRAV